jgi:hypothetical protein
MHKYIFIICNYVSYVYSQILSNDTCTIMIVTSSSPFQTTRRRCRTDDARECVEIRLTEDVGEEVQRYPERRLPRHPVVVDAECRNYTRRSTIVIDPQGVQIKQPHFAPLPRRRPTPLHRLFRSADDDDADVTGGGGGEKGRRRHGN